MIQEYQEWLKKFGDFSKFKVGTRVQIVSRTVDMHFFTPGTTGTVVDSRSAYLGITVKFDKPRQYEDGTILTEFNFNPSNLEAIGQISDEEEVAHIKEQIASLEKRLQQLRPQMQGE